MANADIRIIVQDGIPYIFDATRGKLLSTTRELIRSAVRSREVTNQFMRIEDGLPAMAVGQPIPRPATIVGLSVNTESAATWIFEVYRKPNILLVQLPVTADVYGVDNTLNVDVPDGSILLFKANGTNIPLPVGVVELAWRL